MIVVYLRKNEDPDGRRRSESAYGGLVGSLGVPEESLGALWGCLGDPLETPWGALGVPWPSVLRKIAK